MGIPTGDYKIDSKNHDATRIQQRRFSGDFQMLPKMTSLVRQSGSEPSTAAFINC